MRIFKNYLRTYRKRVGLSQRQVAAILGLRSSTRVSLMELGRSLPSARDVVILSLIFDCPAHELWPYLAEAQVDTSRAVCRLLVELTESGEGTYREQVHIAFVSKNLQAIAESLHNEGSINFT